MCRLWSSPASLPHCFLLLCRADRSSESRPPQAPTRKRRDFQMGEEGPTCVNASGEPFLSPNPTWLFNEQPRWVSCWILVSSPLHKQLTYFPLWHAHGHIHALKCAHTYAGPYEGAGRTGSCTSAFQTQTLWVSLLISLLSPQGLLMLLCLSYTYTHAHARTSTRTHTNTLLMTSLPPVSAHQNAEMEHPFLWWHHFFLIFLA